MPISTHAQFIKKLLIITQLVQSAYSISIADTAVRTQLDIEKSKLRENRTFRAFEQKTHARFRTRAPFVTND